MEGSRTNFYINGTIYEVGNPGVFYKSTKNTSQWASKLNMRQILTPEIDVYVGVVCFGINMVSKKGGGAPMH